MYRKKEYPVPSSNPEKALESAYRASMYILAYRDNTEKMLRDKLKLRHYNENTVEDTIYRLKNEGKLDEDKMAKNYVFELAEGRKFGPARIRSELRSRGFSSETVSGIDMSQFDFVEICLVRLRHLCGNKDAKTVNSLKRYGFDSATIREAYERVEEK